ncbi:MAG TPA: type III pantothenate kinase [Bacillota bacterium]|nr:type III pantothenate kinase [Bacillota bacterium]HOL09058.1 type III pantothenate kinase [Bacillota bacterium]HPO96733.1 type III pantothenate kinase [Bacillota bacterium]
MLLVFDIGNTQIVTGLYQDQELIANWRIQTDRNKTADEYGILLKSFLIDQNLQATAVKAAIISSVVPPVTGTIEKMIQRYFGVETLLVGPEIRTDLNIKYENPREVGADRIVNAVAGIKLYGAPLIIVDFGTATTFCAIAENGDYLGGAIAPGLGIASEALFLRTAKLPRIELIKPKNAIGQNTVSSMQSGLYYGYIGLVEAMIKRFKSEMNANPRVIATGGIADLIAGDTELFDAINPYLTLEGLRIIYELNQTS